MVPIVVVRSASQPGFQSAVSSELADISDARLSSLPVRPSSAALPAERDGHLPGNLHATASTPSLLRLSTRRWTWVDLPERSRPSNTMNAPRRAWDAAAAILVLCGEWVGLMVQLGRWFAGRREAAGRSAGFRGTERRVEARSPQIASRLDRQTAGRTPRPRSAWGQAVPVSARASLASHANGKGMPPCRCVARCCPPLSHSERRAMPKPPGRAPVARASPLPRRPGMHEGIAGVNKLQQGRSLSPK